MDAEEFLKHGREMVDYISKYLETVSDRKPLPSVSPGYLKELVPEEPPQEGGGWEDLLNDLDHAILPGQANPVGTELEVTMMNWLARMLQLPSQFLFNGDSGGGVIQGSASEAILMAFLSARTYMSQILQKEYPEISQGQIVDKLVAYSSKETHSSVEKAALISLIKMRKLPTDENESLRGSTLAKAIKEDLEKGLIPFFLCATVGTTSSCAFDNLTELGPVCNANNIWMHVDAAYAGSACICPEYRYLLDGVEHAMSLNFNLHKWLRVNFDCTAMWVKDRNLLTDAFRVDPVYLRNDEKDKHWMPDYRHWHIPLERRFRAIKIWFVLRIFGVNGLQEQIRKDISLTKQFEKYVREDNRFQVVGKVTLSLVCFRLKGDNQLNETLLKRVEEDRRIYIIPSLVKDTFFLRFTISSALTTPSDVTYAWNVIDEMATQLLSTTK